MTAQLRERTSQATRTAARAGVRATGQQLVSSVGAGPLVAAAAVLLVALIVAVVVAFVSVVALLGGDAKIDAATSIGAVAGSPSLNAQRDIPAAYLPLYQAAADSCPGLPWSVLAAIGKVESDHGRSTAPGVTSAANSAGAAGPMQIGIGGKAGNTFAGYAVDADGGGPDVYNPADAVFTAANYLCRNGAAKGADVAKAVFAYNHADWYVTKVLAIASGYAATQGPPVGAPAQDVAAAAVQFAHSQLGRPYQWGGTGESGGFDCSGLMLRAYQAARVQLPRVSRVQYADGVARGQAVQITDPTSYWTSLEPGDLLFFAHDPTNPQTVHHVGMYAGNGQMIHAPQRNTVVRLQDLTTSAYFRAQFIGATRPTARQGL
jgi:cell wall-associated NlpC family hydrolase